jgi:carbon-monoxide dehydrogenase small subunit
MTPVRYTIYANGERFDVTTEPRKLLADVLREDCQLTGTHLGCEHGVCGACTVLVDGDPVRSCLMFGVQCDGRPVRTIEGLVGDDGALHPLQRAFCEHHALQCGFCTPGFLVLAAALLEHDPAPDDETLRDVLSANLCRCTGYHNIVAAVRAAAEELGR